MGRLLTVLAACALCAACFAGCTAGEQQEQGSATEASSAVADTQASASSSAPQTGTSSSSAAEQATSSSSAQSSASSGQSAASSKRDYSHGEHKAVMRIRAYGVVELEIYSEYAPKTAAKFCELVDEKYYDGKEMYLVLNDIYALLGDPDAKGSTADIVDGEYKEAGGENALSLKRGTLAMSRSVSGKNSDASSLILFLSDCSYLDGKYAAFAKVTEGMDVLDTICSRINGSDKKTRINANKKGEIGDEKERPVIKTIRMVK